ncbi:neutral amino acid transporter [Actinomortierella ambigua]|uniref:Neutral amino acid transporter n=1 Tax=Actinomortierella ambigua TaxID=1343610 RepID=A0A9P6QJC1_9FUNG|nr:neutral amino acid transporter [Actinomortierella ambigua]
MNNPPSPPSQPTLVVSTSSLPSSATEQASPATLGSSTAANSSVVDSTATEAEAFITRAKSTKRLQDKPVPELAAITTAIPMPENLHWIVGEHLAITPTLSGSSDSLNTPTSPSDLTATTPTSTTALDSKPVDQLPLSPMQIEAIKATEITGATANGSPVLDEPSHFQLQGGADTHDVYKWHAKEARRQLGPRSNTYHAPRRSSADMMAADIKTPGGFRRHFVQQDAVARGTDAKIHSKNFIQFLGMFSMYEYDHFAGENFHSVPRRSIVVPRDPEKRKSVAGSLTSMRYLTEVDRVESDEVVIEEPEEKIGFGKAVAMLFKTFIASGILFLPNAFMNGGILFSALFMTLIAALCLHSFLLLVKCREIFPGSYGEIGGHFYGRYMRWTIMFFIAISQFGFCCLGGASLDKVVWIAIFFAILVPFTLVRNIGKLGFSTVIADLCIVVGLIYIYVYDVKSLVVNGGSQTEIQLFNKDNFGLFIGTAVFSYEGIGMVIPICSSMAEPKHFPRALTIVLSIVCALLVSFGCLGYAAYGYNSQTIVLDNLPSSTSGEKAGKNAIQLLYIIAVFLTTPLMLFPCIRIVENLILNTTGESGGRLSKTQWMKGNVIRIVIDVAVALVAYAGYNQLDIFISFVGSLACSPLLFIFPPLFHLKSGLSKALWQKVADVSLILFGLIVMVYTLFETIKGFSKH